jgi:hypothetical protein
VLGFTSHDRDLTVNGVLYPANSGFTGSAIKNQTRLAVDNLEASSLLDSEFVTASDLRAGLWDFAEILLFAVDHTDVTKGINIMGSGRLGEVAHERNTFKAEFRGLANAYTQVICELSQPTCRATLGDARCGVNLAPLTVTGNIYSVSASGLVLIDAARTEAGPIGGKVITNITASTSVNSDDPPVILSQTITITSAAHGFVVGQIIRLSGIVGPTFLNGRSYYVKEVPTANTFTFDEKGFTFTAWVSGGLATPQGDVGYFDYGLITMTSGASVGLSMEVKAYTVGTITLQMQFPLGVAAGDTYSMVAGCGKRFLEDCVGRYNNELNFRGEPHLPGMDAILRIGSDSN